ncbi:MAG: hypothetical protein ACFFE4_23270, partial [Candidatus Thorarchaeota archaeon]
MGTEDHFNYLRNLPTFLFTRLLNEWNRPAIEFKPNGLLSIDNHESTLSIIRDLKSRKIKKLRKLSECLETSNIWWQAYKISKIKPLDNLHNYEREFGVEKYVKKDHQKVKGKLSILDLGEHAILILIEFSSRSPLLRRRYRYFFFPPAKIILLEPIEMASEIMKDEILPLVTKDPSNMLYKKPTARLIKNFTKGAVDTKSPSSMVLTYLKIKISLETSGIEGLNQITIQGDDVIRGAETLEQRHEISLKFMNSGPWVGVGTKDFKLEVG